MDKKEILEDRKQAFNKLEKQLQENVPAEDRFFYYHSSEDRIVLSHALFWIMSRPMEKKLPSIEGFLLLRKYEEEMLVAYLTLSDEFPELLRYCNLTMEVLPHVLQAASTPATSKVIRKLTAIAIVATGYGGDMPDELANELLDDLDFFYNKVRSPLIERMLPYLNKMVEEESQTLNESWFAIRRVR